jgi:hypothetical protein
MTHKAKSEPGKPVRKKRQEAPLLILPGLCTRMQGGDEGVAVRCSAIRPVRAGLIRLFHFRSLQT